MIPDVFKEGGPMNVRGRQVHISVEGINEYYGLENVNHTGGHAQDPILTMYNEELAKDLRMSGTGKWFSYHAVMKREDLQLDSAVWFDFCSYSLFPKSTRGMLIPDMAYVLYSICHNLPINVGYFIRQQISDIRYNRLSGYGFPSLITHFCTHHCCWIGAGITNWLPNTMSLNC
ncbi:hypothetical protein ACOSQ2_019529 [Xanthoceras sorbifolium]